jgi:hypothetical protein
MQSVFSKLSASRKGRNERQGFLCELGGLGVRQMHLLIKICFKVERVVPDALILATRDHKEHIETESPAQMDKAGSPETRTSNS